MSIMDDIIKENKNNPEAMKAINKILKRSKDDSDVKKKLKLRPNSKKKKKAKDDSKIIKKAKQKGNLIISEEKIRKEKTKISNVESKSASTEFKIRYRDKIMDWDIKLAEQLLDNRVYRTVEDDDLKLGSLSERRKQKIYDLYQEKMKGVPLLKAKVFFNLLNKYIDAGKGGQEYEIRRVNFIYTYISKPFEYIPKTPIKIGNEQNANVGIQLLIEHIKDKKEAIFLKKLIPFIICCTSADFVNSILSIYFSPKAPLIKQFRQTCPKRTIKFIHLGNVQDINVNEDDVIYDVIKENLKNYEMSHDIILNYRDEPISKSARVCMINEIEPIIVEIKEKENYRLEDNSISVSASLEDLEKEVTNLIDPEKGEYSEHAFLRTYIQTVKKFEKNSEDPNNRNTFVKEIFELLNSNNYREFFVNYSKRKKASLEKLTKKILNCKFDENTKIITQEDKISDTWLCFRKCLAELEKEVENPVLKAFLRYAGKTISEQFKIANKDTKKRVYSKVNNDDLLFGKSGPKIGDIHQGQLGDCYLLSTLISILYKKQTNYITNCFPEKDTYTRDDAYVKIRLYKVKIFYSYDNKFVVEPFNEIIIEVENTVLMKNYKGNAGIMPLGNDSQNQSQVIWVNFVEKAFSVYKNIPGSVTIAHPYDSEAKKMVDDFIKSPPHPISNQNVSGGFANIAFSIITGKKSSYIDMDSFKSNNYNVQNVFDYIDSCIRNGKILTVSTYSRKYFIDKLNLNEKDLEKLENDKGIYPSHSYSIVFAKTEKEIQYVHLINPHATQSPKTSQNSGTFKRGKPKGFIELEFSEFEKYFGSIQKTKL